MAFSNLLAPGPLYILRSIPTAILPLVGLRGFFAIAEKYLRYSVPWRIRLACYTLSLPSYLACTIIWGTLRKNAKAAWLGAAQVPSLRGRLPGNIDEVVKWSKISSGHSYIGEHHFNCFLHRLLLYGPGIAKVDRQKGISMPSVPYGILNSSGVNCITHLSPNT